MIVKWWAANLLLSIEIYNCNTVLICIPLCNDNVQDRTARRSVDLAPTPFDIVFLLLLRQKGAEKIFIYFLSCN